MKDCEVQNPMIFLCRIYFFILQSAHRPNVRTVITGQNTQLTTTDVRPASAKVTVSVTPVISHLSAKHKVSVSPVIIHLSANVR